MQQSQSQSYEELSGSEYEDEEEEEVEEEPQSSDECFIEEGGEEEGEEEEDEEGGRPEPPKKRRNHQAKLQDGGSRFHEKPSKASRLKGSAAAPAAANRKPGRQRAAAAGPSRKRKAAASNDRGEAETPSRKKKAADGTAVEKYDPPTVQSDPSAQVRDYSRPVVKYCRDKFLIGHDHSLQMNTVNFTGTRNFAMEALTIAREAKKDSEDKSKRFLMNIPAATLVPMRDAATAIIEASGIQPVGACCVNKRVVVAR